MRILRVYTKVAIQSLGVNTTFDITRPVNGKLPTIRISKELNAVVINNTIIPMENVLEIVFETTEEIKEEKKTKKAAE